MKENIAAARKVILNKNSGSKPHIEYHKDGSVQARGNTVNGAIDGCWEWFRQDGSKMRSGHFKEGKQVGEWVTYDRTGATVKITNFKE